MNFLNKFTGVLFFAATAATLTGCDAMFHDDLADCPQGVYVNFYTKTSCETAERDLGKVSQLHVLAFDYNHKLVAVKEEKDVNLTRDHKVLMPVGNGTYSFIGWAGATPALFDNAPLTLGTTTKEDVMLALKHQANGQYLDLAGHQLYQGISEKPILMEDPATHGSVYKNVAVNLLEKTYRIKVQVKVDPSLQGKVNVNDFALNVTGGNGTLQINGETPNNLAVAAYPKTIVAKTNDAYTYDYTTLDLKTGKNNTISLVNTVTNDTIWNADLLGTALLGGPSGLMKNPNVNIDCDHDLDVVFVIGDKCKDCHKPSGTYVCAAIYVNAWLVHSYKYTLLNQ